MARQKGAPFAACTNLQIQGDWGPLTLYTRTQNRVVWFPIADIGKAPSLRQVNQRRRMTLVAQDWQTFSDSIKATWSQIATGAHTWMSGYNLYAAMALNNTIRTMLGTLKRQAHVTATLPIIPR